MGTGATVFVDHCPLPVIIRVAAVLNRGLSRLTGQNFATRLQNVFVIGKSDKPLVSLPKGKGIKLTILQEAAKAKAGA